MDFACNGSARLNCYIFLLLESSVYPAANLILCFYPFLDKDILYTI